LSDPARDPSAFIRSWTRKTRPPLVPELEMWLADEATALWEASEAELGRIGLPPPYWAFAWPGGQALARYLLDRPEIVRGKRVLDFAAGSGIAAIAAARAGAAESVAAEIDAFAVTAIGLNAALNGVEIAVRTDDMLALAHGNVDLILAGDVCYERPMAEAVFRWLLGAAEQGVAVLLADPGRSYLPKSDMEPILSYRVATSRELEDREWRETTVWRVGSPFELARRSGLVSDRP
jgi:predicted nicotinamide N-methyase